MRTDLLVTRDQWPALGEVAWANSWGDAPLRLTLIIQPEEALSNHNRIVEYLTQGVNYPGYTRYRYIDAIE